MLSPQVDLRPLIHLWSCCALPLALACLPVCEQIQVRSVLALAYWLLCWMARRLMMVPGGAASVWVLAWRPGLLPVEPQVTSWEPVAVGEALHGLAQERARASRVLWLVPGEGEPVQHEVVWCESLEAEPGWGRREAVRAERVLVPGVLGREPVTVLAPGEPAAIRLR